MNKRTVEPSSNAYVVVTGASRGLGRLFAIAFAERGYHLLLVARAEDELSQVAEEVRKKTSRTVRTLSLDLIEESALETLEQVASTLPVYGLVNNAGVGMGGAFQTMRRPALRAMLELNIVSLTHLIHALLPALEKNRGFVINLASQASFQPIPFMAAYAASKAYVLHLTEALACELASAQVQFLAVCPGPTKTEFFNVATIDVKTTRFTLGAPEAVVKTALGALDRGQVHVVVGLMTKVAAFSTRFLSRRFLARATQKLMGY